MLQDDVYTDIYTKGDNAIFELNKYRGKNINRMEQIKKQLFIRQLMKLSGKERKTEQPIWANRTQQNIYKEKRIVTWKT